MFPPPIFAGTASIFVFCIFPPPPRENTLGGLYIVVLGQADQSGTKMDGIGASRSKRTWMAWHG
jgi:hypothetical protein